MAEILFVDALLERVHRPDPAAEEQRLQRALAAIDTEITAAGLSERLSPAVETAAVSDSAMAAVPESRHRGWLRRPSLQHPDRFDELPATERALAEPMTEGHANAVDLN